MRAKGGTHGTHPGHGHLLPSTSPQNLAGQVLEVSAEDPGVLQYDWFFNADQTRCVVRETYKNSEAVLIHLGVVGEMIAPLVEVAGGIEVEVFGSPSEQVVQAIEMLRPTYYTYF